MSKIIDKTVFTFFDKFTNAEDEVRIQSASRLITYLNNGNESDVDQRQKERSYSLKRLVRGLGSNTNTSRAGFYTAFVVYLEQVRDTSRSPTISDIFDLVKSELTDSDKDDEDKGLTKLELRVGKVLVCGAIIESGLIENASETELQIVIKTLKKGIYKVVTPLAMIYLSELVKKIDTNKFCNVLWPIIEPIMNIRKESHTINTVYFLLAAATTHKKAVNKKFFENNFDSPQLLHTKNFAFLAHLLLDITNTIAINHPLYDFLIEQLVNNDKLKDFLVSGIEPCLREEDNSYKYKEIVCMRLLITVFNRLDNPNQLPDLLGTTLLDMIIKQVKNFSQLSTDVQDLYQEAFDAMCQCYPKIDDEDSKLRLFNKLVTAPSTILIEKYISKKPIQNLLQVMNKESIMKTATLLKEIILGADESNISSTERIYAAQTFQKLLFNSHMSTEYAWRQDNVKFIINLGIFYSIDGKKIIKQGKHTLTATETELASTMRSLFFHCLEFKHAKVNEEKSFLLAIVEHINQGLETVNYKSLRVELSEDQLQHWNRMYHIVHSKSKQDKRIYDIFHILMMYMGLHLFKDPLMAISSIAELESVMKRVSRKSNKQMKEVNVNESSNEPEWIEVVVDLFLNLMSQNSHLLRKVIGHIFPHLASRITLTAFNQILSVINLKDKTNPLSIDDSASIDDNDQQKLTDGDLDSETDDDSDKSEDDGDDEDTENLTDSEEEEKISDKMRLAIQEALGMANPATDTESVDLDNMSDEEGRRLDEALSAAFRLFKQSKKSKPTKADEKLETTLNHFRMRVLDLVSLYIKSTPKMAVCIELLLYIFEMLPVAMKDTKLKQILNRYQQISSDLVKIKQFNPDQDVTTDQLPQVLSDIVKKATALSFAEKNQYILKACQFVINCMQSIGKTSNYDESSTPIEKLFNKYLKKFITERNPPISLEVFLAIFRGNWLGSWHLAKTLSKNGLKKNTRSLRKMQTLLLLRDLSKNKRLINSDIQTASKAMRNILKHLVSYMNELQESNSETSQNEFCELIQLLQDLQRIQQHFPTIQISDINEMLTLVQKVKPANMNKKVMNHYLQFCKHFDIPPTANKTKEEHSSSETCTPKVNGVDKGNKRASNQIGKNKSDEADKIQTKKRKKQIDFKKEKRLRKEDRLNNASNGMESISFANIVY